LSRRAIAAFEDISNQSQHNRPTKSECTRQTRYGIAAANSRHFDAHNAARQNPLRSSEELAIKRGWTPKKAIEASAPLSTP
jgi:hypothetical protein